ncbi:MAG TPA: hypothetical protein VN822_02080 [Candidatus Acidoferrales bacterium]|nr:hypothetical protein [Candidatus Acidoferrales bacterium]
MRRAKKNLWGFIVAALAWAAFVFATAAQDFKRPAPTPADWAALAKLPDFTGVWEVRMGGPPITNPAVGVPPLGRPAPLSLTPEYAAKKKQLQTDAPDDNQSANCLPPGMPGIMAQPYPLEFLLTPGQVTIVIEAYSQVRHIYTDGRPLPSDPDPSFFGTSIGHWEGNTLVAESVGFSPLTELEPRTPHSDKMRILERFRLADPDTMVIETTITDPEALTAPNTTSRILKRHRSWTIAEYICEQNNRNFVDRNGKAGINLTPPGGTASKPQ